jgi:signal peptidase I
MSSSNRISVAGGTALRLVGDVRLGALATYPYSIVWLVMAVAGLAAFGGFDAMLISSGSMSPAIRTGDVVFIAATDGLDLEPGTVITFQDAALGDRIITHRIDSVTEDGSYITKGDANLAPDSDAVAPEDVIGAGKALVPFVGLPAHWMKQGEWLPLSLWLAATIAAIVSVMPVRRTPDDPEGTPHVEHVVEETAANHRTLARVGFAHPVAVPFVGSLATAAPLSRR